MTSVTLTIDDHTITVPAHATILEAARLADIYLPTLCAHPSLPGTNGATGSPSVFRGKERIESDDPSAEWDGCGLCAVEIEGESELVCACATEVMPGQVVRTHTDRAAAHRRERLSEILSSHPHACLTCAQAEGCSLTQCSSNVPEEERCCLLLGSCELQRVVQYVGVPENLPRYRPRGLTKITDEPLFDWNPELCVACLRCVRACRELREVGALSFVMTNGRPTVGTTVGPSRIESHCRFCGACVEVCPTGALLDKVRAVGDERERTLVPCRSGCPAGVDIPRFVRHLAEGQNQNAIAVIREKLPFSFAPSYVCFHPCEDQCRRGSINEPIAICQLKRFAADHDRGEWRARRTPPSPTGKTVAVVGSGPAGLTAAFYLARKGHRTTIFEALPQPGGMLRVGIPRFRYPLELLNRDIDDIREAGVEIRTDAPIAGHAAFEKLTEEYDAVFLATGAHESKRITVPGDDLTGIYWGVAFLRECALNGDRGNELKGRRVIVVGGGNVAVDAARVARRFEPEDVLVVTLEPADELPAYDWEVQEALEEGIRFQHTWGVREIRGKGGYVSSMVLKRCIRVFDDRGRFAPAYNDSRTCEEAADIVILAIGQDPSSQPFTACGIAGNGTILVEEETLATRISGVYAGGDVVTGPASVIEAIATGRRSASAIDKALGGDGNIDEVLLDPGPASPRLGLVENFATIERTVATRIPDPERLGSFALIENGLSFESAGYEAGRCLACDRRLAIECVPLPPRAEALLELRADVIANVPESEGVYQLFDANENVLAIKGVMNLRAALTEACAGGGEAQSFTYEEDPMFTRRESELIQQYLQDHGQLPAGDDELEDLF